MATRANAKACPLARGFLLGMLYAGGKVLTSDRIRRELGVSRATSKRDMSKIAGLVPVTPSKPIRGLKAHATRRTVMRGV